MVQGWIRVFILGTVVLLAACTRLAPYEAEENELEHAEQLISQGKSGEAREILVRLHQQDPSWARPKILLSAIEMSGLKFDVSSLFPLIRTFVDAPSKTPLPPTASRTRKTLRELKELIAEVELVVERFEKIPTVPAEDVVALEKAQGWIQSIQPPTPGQALYRATLRLVVVKSRGAILLSKSGKGFGQNICEWKGADFLNWISSETAQVEAAISDLAIAFPNSKVSFSDFLKQLQAILTPIKNQISPPDSTIKDILDQRAFAVGLEELSPCN
ncbi:MAG: hypothetical protein K2X47_18045 [Bdellovibrionales bacterium]|nr:hypothetical protein [Bdellovibrionales bacterium]